jgi:Fungal specific transcription factor domain
LRIQWDQGVASRGKLKGKSLPLSSVKSTGYTNLQEANQAATLRPIDRRSQPGRHVRHNHHVNVENVFSNSSWDIPTIANTADGKSIHELLQYYDHAVAGAMPWMDSPANPWRTVMLPLAAECTSLLYAIAALAAEHRASKHTPDPAATSPRVVVSSYRDCSLHLLAQGLRAELRENDAQTRQSRASGLLATILVLANLEMVLFDPDLWKIHWSAARTIVKRWTGSGKLAVPLDDRCRFLVREAFIYDVFAATTRFDCSEQIPASVIQEESQEPFIEYLKILQQVTQADRRPCHDQHGVDTLTARFDAVRISDKQLMRKMSFSTSDDEQDFEAIIDIFHYSGMLYALRTIYGDHGTEVLRARLIVQCCACLSSIRHLKLFEHDLVWPLFILGTEARSLPEIQDLAESRLSEIMASTGFRNCHPALAFLQRYWQTDSTTVEDWLAYGRQETEKGLVIFVI